MLNWGVILFAIIVAGGVIAGTAYYFWSEYQREKRNLEGRFRDILLWHIGKKGPTALNFNLLVEENEIPIKVARETAANLYAGYCKNALADTVITDAERRQLDILRHALTIPPSDAASIEAKIKEEKYRSAALGALADGTITHEEAGELERLRQRLGLSVHQNEEIIGDQARKGYLALFRRVIDDGRITIEELDELRRFRKALGINTYEANEISHKDVLGLYRQWFHNIKQDGQVTLEEEQGLTWLKSEFGLDSSDTSKYDSQLQVLKQLASYRNGQLPTLKTRKLLESGEICHWESPCCFQWETGTKTKESEGDLVVTSEKLVFTSQSRSFSVPPSKILDIKVGSNGIEIQSGSSRGTGFYFIGDPKKLEAILVGLVRRHKFHLDVNYSSNLTRHIPDQVRREVWHRDGGMCVRCKAMDYLEFDHIIPHSKGGANSLVNIQLLCRRCNNYKRDRI